mmetsp:Transcript_30224/g.63301  ORF Transcript_30224/g.63301 Transcript_30224/m.63301 type:complete len:109 (-) Transcript_30224:19-345(-)
MHQLLELRAGSAIDEMTRGKHIAALFEQQGKITSARSSGQRQDSIYRNALQGTGCIVKAGYPNSVSTAARNRENKKVWAKDSPIPAAGGYHPNLSVWGGKVLQKKLSS